MTRMLKKHLASDNIEEESYIFKFASCLSGSFMRKHLSCDLIMIMVACSQAFPPSDSAHNTHTDLSCITMELWEILVLFTDGWRNDFTYE